MDLPGDILDGVSRFFAGDGDEILLYVLVFLFFFITVKRDENILDKESLLMSGVPVILIVVFLLFSALI